MPPDRMHSHSGRLASARPPLGACSSLPPQPDILPPKSGFGSTCCRLWDLGLPRKGFPERGGSSSSEPQGLFAVTLLGQEHCWCVNNSLLEAKRAGGSETPASFSSPQPVAHPRPELQSCWHSSPCSPSSVRLLQRSICHFFPFLLVFPLAGASAQVGECLLHRVRTCSCSAAPRKTHGHESMDIATCKCFIPALCSRASLCMQAWENHSHSQDENWDSQV